LAITYLHVCINCQESYSDQHNSPKSDSVCPTCTMMPEYHTSDLDLLTNEDLGQEAGESDVRIFTTEASGAHHIEVIPGAKRPLGRPRKSPISPNTAVYKIAERQCELCHRTYKPKSHRQKVCVLCKDDYTKIKTAEKRERKNLLKREARAQLPKTQRALEMGADRLLREAKAEAVKTVKPKTFELVVDTAGTTLEPRFTSLKRQPPQATYDGFWVLEKTGMTHDNRPYDIRKSPITGQIAICLCNPTEVYLSDATTQTPL
jgi:hypothetical protein